MFPKLSTEIYVKNDSFKKKKKREDRNNYICYYEMSFRVKVCVGAVNSLFKESVDGSLLIFSEMFFFVENSETSTDNS